MEDAIQWLSVTALVQINVCFEWEIIYILSCILLSSFLTILQSLFIDSFLLVIPLFFVSLAASSSHA